MVAEGPSDLKMEVDQENSAAEIASTEGTRADIAPEMPHLEGVEPAHVEVGAVPVVEDIIGSKTGIDGSTSIVA